MEDGPQDVGSRGEAEWLDSHPTAWMPGIFCDTEASSGRRSHVVYLDKQGISCVEAALENIKSECVGSCTFPGP